MPKKGEYNKFQNFWRKKSPLMIYADFKNILVSDDGKQI